jgi:ketosteroid isomerase-like protein
VPEANVDLARRAFAAFAERDLPALLALMDPDVEFLPVTATVTMNGRPYRGHDGIARYMDDVGRVWNELRVYPSEFRELPDCVIAVGRIHARGGGMIVDRPTGWVWRMRAGKIVWGRVYATPEEALQAAGLSDREDEGGDDGTS